MTATRHPTMARVADTIGKICTQHELSRETLARLLAITLEQLTAWEAGEAILPLVATRLHKLDRDLNFAGLAAWKRRIAVSAGRECLIGRDLRILAITRATFRAPADPPLETGAPAIAVGHDYRHLLPLKGDLRGGKGGGVLTNLESRGFFDSRIRCVRVDADLEYGAFAYRGVWEIWPVATLDAGIVAHLVFHAQTGVATSGTSSGVVLRQIEFIPTDTEIANMDQDEEWAESSR